MALSGRVEKFNWLLRSSLACSLCVLEDDKVRRGEANFRNMKMSDGRKRR